VTVRERARFGEPHRTLSPRWNPRGLSQLAVTDRRGGFGAARLASATLETSRKHPVPRFGSGSGEARRDLFARGPLTCEGSQ
jgi:hypothetical protein